MISFLHQGCIIIKKRKNEQIAPPFAAALSDTPTTADIQAHENMTKLFFSAKTFTLYS